MTIATNTLEVSPVNQGTVTSRWRVNASSTDVSGCEEIVAAPGDGYELVVTRLSATISTTATVTIGMGAESGACKQTLLGPLGGAAMAVDLNFGEHGLVLDPNVSLTIDASGAATVWVYVEGMTRVCESAGIASHTPSSSVSGSPSASVSSSAS